MNAGWRVIDFSNFSGEIRYSRGQLRIRADSGEDEVAVPLKQVSIVLIGGATTISGSVMGKLSEYDVALLVCDWRKVPVAGAAPWSEHTRIGARQRAQASVSLPRRKAAWARIVAAKILGQAKVAEALGVDSSVELAAMVATVRSGDPDNREAVAARRYWGSLNDRGCFQRHPGAGVPGWNSALDYGYTILRGHGIRAVAGAGLAGSLGVFHRGRSNPFSLVDDLIEPFRPAIDFKVVSSIAPDGELDARAKRLLVAACEEPFVVDGRTVATVLLDFARDYGMYIEGETNKLLVPSWRGPVDAEEGQ